MEKLLRTGEKLIPPPLYRMGQPFYHRTLAFLGALLCGFPSKKIKIIAVTGTKGKSSTTEIINAVLEEAGFKTALSNTIRFKIGDESEENLFKMSMPGRFFIQKFIKRAVEAKCDFIVMEITSQGAMQYRNRFIDLDAFVFTNLAPEHIESHGSYENYIEAKVGIAREIEKSFSKQNKAIIINTDDKEAHRFLNLHVENKIKYSITDANPFTILPEGIDFTWDGKRIHSPLSGLFNLYNILAAIKTARHFGITDEVITRAIEKFSGIKGRVEKVEAGQNFTVIVDNAHTPESLEALYSHFKNQRIIAVFGSTGGGRDTWKRKVMGQIADKYASEIILTDDDSYDDDTKKICEEIAIGITKNKPVILIDRREAIREAFKRAQPGDAVLLIGKGTDPYLMGPNGKKTPWSDVRIAKEELAKLL